LLPPFILVKKERKSAAPGLDRARDGFRGGIPWAAVERKRLDGGATALPALDWK
jgi:hypothetical protein